MTNKQGLRRDGRSALLLGPYKTKRTADNNVRRAHELAEAIDPFCHFDAPGVFKLWMDNPPRGKLMPALKPKSRARCDA